jgi:hypothetical protein
MAEERPDGKGFVAEAHARGLLTFDEVAKLLDLRTTDVLDLMRDGHIESERIDNKPCAPLTALDAYRRRQLRAGIDPSASASVSRSGGASGPSPSSSG